MRDQLIELQRLLLPQDLPEIHCTEAAAEYRAMNHQFRIGGDWYDLIDRREQNEIVAIVGDVVGHGVEQISVMGQLRSAANALARVCGDPAELLDALDRVAGDVAGARLATVAVVVLDGTDVGRVALAGHPPPLRISVDGEVDVLELGRGPALGLGGSAVTGTFQADVGDLIVLYTDGVVGRRDVAIDDGIEALAEFLVTRRTEPCSTLARAIVDEFIVDQFTADEFTVGAGGDRVDDDRAVMVLRPVHDRSPRYQLIRPQTPSAGFG